MPSPKSPFRQLSELLSVAPSLRGNRDLRIQVGARELSAATSPPLITLYPTEGAFKNATNSTTSIRDVEQQIAARIWGSTLDEAWDLQQRLFQALEYQAAMGGVFWKALSVEWDPAPPASKTGQELEVLFTAYLSLDRVPQATGEVDAISYVEQ